ncbi:prefoldin subunit 2 [Thraustotheca clavata]|uniref:Prefoldin subunit 2 n=1 Tax=Thraustotheca clavata TaxID=74557 RepID=A0A1V9YSB5_9STRA|nr:prefoldin subunit 2 [Thraustotheca clavata]
MADVNEQQVVAQYKGMRTEIRQLAEKLAELELELNEHQRVAETLKSLEGNRRAFRMVGGVLVERTVAEVVPAVVSNGEGIQKVMGQVEELLKQKEAAANAWQTKYNIKSQ